MLGLIQLASFSDNEDKINKQIKELERLNPNIKVFMIDDRHIKSTENFSNLKRYGGNIYRLLAFLKKQSSQRDDIMLKLYAEEYMDREKLSRLSNYHEETKKMVSLFCPSVSRSTSSKRIIAEIWSLGKINVPTGLFGIIHNAIYDLRRLIKSRELGLRAIILRSGNQKFIDVARYIRKMYQSLFLETSGFANKSLDGNDCSLPEQCSFRHDYPFDYSIYYGDREDHKYYLVDRVSDFIPFPRSIHFVTSNVCNLKCLMCPYHSPRYENLRQSDFFSKRRFVSLGLVNKIAEEMSTYGTSVSLGQLEEPLLHPQIIDIVNSFASRGIYVHLTTNGTMVNKERAKALVDAGLKSIAFSIDAITPETYRRIRGHNLNEVVENMRFILTLRKESKINISTRVCIINQEGADQEISKFIEFWKGEGIDCVSVYQLTLVEENAEVRVNKLNYPLAREIRYPCGQLWEQCFVYPNGEVSICCTTMFSVPKFGILSMGNVSDQTLKEIWCGERYSQVRRSLIDAMWEKIPQCENCLIWRNYETIYEKIDRTTVRGYNAIEEFYLFDRRRKSL